MMSIVELFKNPMVIIPEHNMGLQSSSWLDAEYSRRGSQ